MVDNGIDRVIESIESLRSEMGSTEDRMLERIESLRSDMDAKFEAIDDRLKTMGVWLPIKSAFFTLAPLAAAVAIFGL